MKLYNMYCIGHASAMSSIEELKKGNTKASELLKTKTNDGLDIMSCLIRPVRRIPK